MSREQYEDAPSVRDRLAKLVRDAATRCGDNFCELERQINAANEPFKKGGIGRRKLREIAKGDDVAMRPDQLQALDKYLKQEGEGLVALFDRPSIIKALVEEGHVAFMLGSRPWKERQTIELSGWDFRSVNNVLHSIYKVTTAVQINVEEVFLRHEDDITGETYQEILDGESWMDILDGGNGPSVVCVGSPRACHASEVVLASMMNIRPFERPSDSPQSQLPFYLVWSQEQYDELPSAFALSESVLPDHADNGVRSQRKALALRVDGEFYRVHREGHSWSTYGVISAQRRRTGQVWVAIIGLNGPGTLAAARLINSITRTLPQGEIGEHGPVLWAVVTGEVEKGHRMQADRRELMNEKLMFDPRIWPPDKK